MTTTLTVLAIEPSRLEAMRAAGADEHGNPFVGYSANGWEPLRCCLRVARPDEQIALIGYRPFRTVSPWAEVGPVYVHAAACEGYPPDAGLPPELRTGRMLRGYHADGSLAYDHITRVPEGVDIEASLRALLAAPEVAEVHVRAVETQCFAYAVRG
ncbi:MAG TPA: DUF1203 domain-containing protein [Jatrophihabitans sp.]|nr:DUF1203 domain-containing protein [Jatrophihabitans sp.]